MLRKMALACAVLVLAITTFSAFIRLARTAPACEPWPGCQATVAPAATGAPPAAVVTVVRVAHRIAAGAALLLIVLMLVRVNTGPALREANALVLALLALAVFLAVLGRMGAGSLSPAVVLGNLAAGFGMVAAGWRLVAVLADPTGTARSAPPQWLAALVVVGADAAAGAWVSASGVRVGFAAGAHRVGGVLALVLLLSVGVSAWRSGRRGRGGLLVALVVLESTATFPLLAGSPPWPQVLAHNALAALLLAALVVPGGVRPR